MHALFPSLASFLALAKEKVVGYDLAQLYRKHSDLNRYTIRTAQGPLALTAEIAGPRWQVPYGEVRLGYDHAWPARHMKTLRSAYRAAPFFDHYVQEIERILTQRHDFLYQLSIEALSFCLLTVKSGQPIEILTQHRVPETQIEPAVHIITADTDVTPEDAPLPTYRSVFGADFDTRVSVLDALFCAGPHQLRTWFRMYE